jgi:hypothetical protein
MPRKVTKRLQPKKGGKVQKGSVKKKTSVKELCTDRFREIDQSIVDTTDVLSEHLKDSSGLVNNVTAISEKVDEHSLIIIGLSEIIKDLQWRVENLEWGLGIRCVGEDDEENSSALTDEEIREILKETEEESGGNE